MSLPALKPVQLGLPMPGCESPIELAWKVHAKHLPGMTLEQALERPLVGRVLRCHAASIERLQGRRLRRKR